MIGPGVSKHQHSFRFARRRYSTEVSCTTGEVGDEMLVILIRGFLSQRHVCAGVLKFSVEFDE